MFITLALKMFVFLTISMGVFTNGADHVQRGEVFHIVAIVTTETHSKQLNTHLVLPPTLELVSLTTSPYSRCPDAACTTDVGSTDAVMLVAYIRVKEKAPIGLTPITLNASDAEHYRTTLTKMVFIGTVEQPAPAQFKHRISYFPSFRH